MEFRMRQFRWHGQFHGIPWNLKCANFADTRSSMEFHGTWSASISLTRAVPWNSMEFHGTLTRAVPWNSMELECANFHGTECANFESDLKCANFADTRSSMEFHGTWSASISLTRAVPWNSMEFHGTWSAPISLTREVPWNSMEFHGTRSVPISSQTYVHKHAPVTHKDIFVHIGFGYLVIRWLALIGYLNCCFVVYFIPQIISTLKNVFITVIICQRWIRITKDQ